jgi:nucleotide-binding universal stress UspA family protein
LTIMTVGSPRQSGDEIQFAQVEGDVASAAESFARRTLLDGEERARRAGIAAPKTQLAWGDATREIIGLVQAEKPDALVIGRRGHGVLAGLLLGSVSQKLVTLASCPVIVVP